MPPINRCVAKTMYGYSRVEDASDGHIIRCDNLDIVPQLHEVLGE
jgi:hypothetical protein